MDLTNAITETLNLGFLSIPSRSISTTHTCATESGTLELGDYLFDVKFEAVIERPYDGDWSATLSFVEAECNSLDSIILTFSIECEDD